LDQATYTRTFRRDRRVHIGLDTGAACSKLGQDAELAQVDLNIEMASLHRIAPFFIRGK
jgi:hypothetical protein